jgi:hypothetical protein
MFMSVFFLWAYECVPKPFFLFMYLCICNNLNMDNIFKLRTMLTYALRTHEL